MDDSKPDMVNEPPHYQGVNGLECIDAIQAATADLQGFEGYCIGNAIKYLWRWKAKGGLQDLEKARWYLDRVIDEVGAQQARETREQDQVLINALRVPAARPEMDAYDKVEAHYLAGRFDRG